MQEKNKNWPPAPLRPVVVRTADVRTRASEGLLTNHFLLDFVLGLVLGPTLHVLLLMSCMGLLGTVAHGHHYRAWALALSAGILLSVLLFRRYPYLVVGFASTNIPTAMFSFVVVGLSLAAPTST